ncbi:hypothetical protein QP185_18280 [Sphingomonas aerolata]
MAGADGDFDGIGIVAGGKILGYHEDYLAQGLVNVVPIGPSPYIEAWRLWAASRASSRWSRASSHSPPRPPVSDLASRASARA